MWLRGVLEPAQTELLCDWLRRGGPAVEAAPRSLLACACGPAAAEAAGAQAWAAFQLLSSSPCRPNISACSSGSPWS
jgi:hypothetical protein